MNGDVEKAARPKVDSVERALSQVGDAWSFLVLREAFFGARRFDDFQKGLSVAPNILSNRLKKMVGHGLLEKVPYSQHARRFEYHLTDKGRDLYPAIVLLMQWGDRWLDEGKGAPLELLHKPCGKITRPVLNCEHCAKPITARNIDWRPGPGAHSQT